MSTNKGAFNLALVDAASKPWSGEAEIRIYNDQDRVVYDARKRYVGPVRFEDLLAVPRGLHRVHIKTVPHVPVSRFLTVFSTNATECVVPLLVDQDVADRHADRIIFPQAFQLETLGLASLRRAIDSPDPNLKIDDGGVLYLKAGLPDYDGLVERKQDAPSRRAAACLFNLYSKMARTAVAEGNAWDLVKRVVALKQDRIYCELNADKAAQAYQALQSDQAVQSADSDTHQVPGPANFKKTDRTFKTRESFGNLQLTFWHDGGNPLARWCMDADIDERSGLGHILDAIYHSLTGAKTSPYLVHQLLSRQGQPPPYALVVEPAA